ncbi:MAG: hypothetical protein Q9191_005822 [Dirinaria sp. TL-2023a]
MSTVQPTATVADQGPVHTESGRRRWRGNRRGNARAHTRRHSGADPNTQQARHTDDEAAHGNRDAALAFRPASVAPGSDPAFTDPSSAEASAVENGSSGAAKARGGERGQGAGGRGGRKRQQVGAREQAVNHTNYVTGRQFGGRLTAETELNALANDRIDTATLPANSTRLHGDASEFHPGQQHQPRNRTEAKAPNQQRANPRRRRESLPKSKAADIPTRTHEDIANNLYECPICTNEIGPKSKVWQCRTCWTVFHLSCIKKWSTNEGAAAAQQRTQEGDFPPPRQWRCPGCNLPKDNLPSTYNCWCEKETDPRSISGLPPHSCGQTCGKHRMLPKKCPHPCDLLCHAGPCPPCTHLGPTQSCHCGKQSVARRCVETQYDSGWSCGQICGDLMPCGQHTCQRPCHEGLCGACEVELDCRCYCGQVERRIECCDRGDEKPSTKVPDPSKGTQLEHWIGSFKCANLCQRSFDCGKHQCEKGCHSQDPQTPHCPRSPDVITHCPCGKTSLQEICDVPRDSCTARIPNCDRQCLKTLECGHKCQQICHSGECMPCLMTTNISCRCGRVLSPTICHQGHEEPPQCMRACKATLNCGRHECGERCCPGERKAAERQATKRKLRPLGAGRIIDEGIEAEHICTRSCGRPLKCGNHTCPELCHKGPCGTCREAVFEEISCHCGRTTLQPPLPCGTSAPPCRFDCERPTSCGHPRIPHNCHGSEQQCPKCPFLQEKPCMCGKKRLKNQPCWLADVRCGEICGKRLKCGSHYCRKPCHRAGECEDAGGKTCQQSCGKPKKICGHPCEEPCHAPSTCREDKPCQNRMLVTCECQHLKQEVTCNASKASDGNMKRSLQCDDECARLARNQKLALALDIDPKAHQDDHVPYSTGTMKMFRENMKWAQAQEKEFRVFAADENEKRLRFKPMPSPQRAFLHSLSEDFGFDSESMDPEPHRHVAIFKTPKFVMAPMKTLSECLRIRQAEAAAMPAIESQSKLQSSNEPFNGFLLTSTRFGLTVDELRTELSSVLDTIPAFTFDTSFQPNEEIVIKCRPSPPTTAISSDEVAATLQSIKASLASIVASKHLAYSVQLCATDSSLNVLRRENVDAASNGGWSQVAAKAAAPRTAPRQVAVGQRSPYTVLGSKLREAKKKREQERKVKEEVVDNWEEELRKDEQADGGAEAIVGLEDQLENVTKEQ